MMDGDAGAESVPGEGSTFWFTAKLRRGDGQAREGKESEHPDPATELQHKHAGARILLAEDNTINAEVARTLLHRAGLNVDIAVNGEEAVSAVRSQHYDLVLMDLQMPEMDGLDATRIIRSMTDSCNDTRNLPIIAMTANIFEEERRRCRDVGMNDFVAKPVNPDTLFSRIVGWLGEKN
jgi:CheY-like chemotaxis protein